MNKPLKINLKFTLMLIVFAIVTIVNGCRKLPLGANEAENTDLVKESMSLYNKTLESKSFQIQKLASTKGSGSIRTQAITLSTYLINNKTLDWENAKLIYTRVGPALHVPIIYPPNTTITINDSQKFSLDKATYALFYHKKNGELNLKLLPQLETKSFIDDQTEVELTLQGL
jgi:hypothetical protein